MIARLLCWWFGCRPHPHADPYSDLIPCDRCGAADTSYSDRVCDTRHNRLVERWHWLAWWTLRRWIPHKCHACGGRWSCRPDCHGDVPF